MLTAFETDCPRCVRLGKPKTCIACRELSPVKAIFCQRCGHRFGEPLPPALPQTPPAASAGAPPRTEPAAPAASPVPAQTRASGGSITTMWLLSLVAWVLFLAGAAPVGILLDLVTVIIALTLVGSRSGTDRTNGWIKLTIEGMGFNHWVPECCRKSFIIKEPIHHNTGFAVWRNFPLPKPSACRSLFFVK